MEEINDNGLIQEVANEQPKEDINDKSLILELVEQKDRPERPRWPTSAVIKPMASFHEAPGSSLESQSLAQQLPLINVLRLTVPPPINRRSTSPPPWKFKLNDIPHEMKQKKKPMYKIVRLTEDKTKITLKKINV